jgi:tight adherence protein B
MSAVLAGCAVAMLVPVVIETALKSLRVARMRSQLTHRESNSTWQVLRADLSRNGVAFLRPLATLLLRLPAVVNAVTPIVEEHQSWRREEGANLRAVTESLILVGVLSALVVFLLFGQALLAGASLFLPMMVVTMHAKQWHQKQKRLLLEQLPDALRSLGMCFSAGFSLQQSLEQTAQEAEQPLSGELLKTASDMQTGCSILESLRKLDERVNVSELRFVSVAMEIQHSTGGSLREILDCAAHSLDSSFELERSLSVQTAQARMSARVVTVMPLALMLVLSLAMEGYLATFFTNPVGFGMLIVALGMELVGVLAIRKILGLDLE